MGEIDFHWLSAGFSVDSLYGVCAGGSANRQLLLTASADRGQTWSRHELGSLGGEFSDLQAHPTRDDIVYILSKTGIYRSTDRGATFRRFRAVRGMIALAAYRDGSRIIVGGRSLISYDADGRNSRTLEIPELDENDAIREIAVGDPGSGLLAYITGLYLSRDDGSSWQRILTGGNATH